MSTLPTQRIAYLDWLRGFAVLLMFQTHCYDSWLGGAARQSQWMAWSQLLGTLPAPLFLFLSGISLAMVVDRRRGAGATANAIARQTIERGAMIWLLAIVFRLQEFLLGVPGARWTDILRVDVLNVIGLSMILLGGTCWIAAMGRTEDPEQLRTRSIWLAIVGTAVIVLVTPLLWTVWRPRWLPWWLESYVNGVHTFDRPQPWLFPLFPWSAFAFAGLAVGFFLTSVWSKKNRGAAVGLCGLAGIALAAIAYWLDHLSVHLYPIYDFWHTSPNFFLIRTGLLMALMVLAYGWCRWGAGKLRFSPLREMGKCSLLVYWVHIEFVYGRLSLLPKKTVGIGAATLGLLIIFISMTLLAIVRNRYSGWRKVIPVDGSDAVARRAT